MRIAVIGLVAASVVAITYAALSTRAARRAARDLHRAATHDHLTGLPGRVDLDTTVNAQLERARKAGTRIAVLALELNRFASVNQIYGYEVGDALMIEAARQLSKARRPDEHLARYGGPQFIMVSPGVADSNAALRRAHELQKAVQVPYKIGTDDFRITAGVGVVSTDHGEKRGGDIVDDALVALREANDRGPGQVALFDLAMRERLAPLSSEHRLSEALERNEYWVLYLPVVALDTYEIVGIEALLRWGDPARGMVAPSDFLAGLDRTGLIVPVGAWVTREACTRTAAWSKRFPGRELVTTVNVSQRQLTAPDFLESVLSAISDAGIEPDRLCLEITAGALTRDTDRAWAVLRQAKDAGIKLALDDFGIGFSSLSNLRHFDLDVLKIDRTFIEGLGSERGDEAIVQQLVGLAHSLGIVPVAEGVETAEVAQVLQGMRCDFAQGYWFSEPQPADTIDKMLERGRIRPGVDGPGIDWSGGQAAGPVGGQPTAAERPTNSSAGTGGANR